MVRSAAAGIARGLTVEAAREHPVLAPRRREDGGMRWVELEQTAARLAQLAKDRLIAPGVVLVVTIRRDGAPRLSPVEPLLLDGDLWLSMMWRSRKAVDIFNDDRVLVHSIVTDRENHGGEIKLRGRAIAIDDPEQRRHYIEAVSVLGWRPVEPYFHLYRIDISDVTLIRYDQRTGDQHVARWPELCEFARRATSDTSVGEPEPTSDVFGPGG